MEPTLTAEDLTLYALDLLEADERGHVEAMLRRSTAAREELSCVQGDLALFALATDQHTPQTLTRQRLLKQVARERRTVPVPLPVDDGGTAAKDAAARAQAPDGRSIETQRVLQTQGQRAAEPEAPRPAQITEPAETRTFLSRSQQRAASASTDRGLPLQRAVQERGPLHTEAETPADVAAEPSLPVAPASFTVDRPTFSPDPEVYPREARSLSTSATAHSVTMFEQHFASQGASPEGNLEQAPDLEVNPERRRNSVDDALAGIQDRFVPSPREPNRPEPSLSLTSYRDQDAVPSQANALGRWVGWSGWAVAAVLAIGAIVFMRDDFHLREQVSRQQTQMTQAQANALKAQMVMQTLESPATEHFLLARTDAAPAPSGRVSYLPEYGTLVFQGNNLETLQPYKTYELWLIPSGGDRQPVPAGLFKPDGHGYATVVLPEITKGLIAGNFGVTIEDEGGSTTPTLPILLVGQQS